MGQEKGWNLPPTIMGLDFVPGASLERRPPGSATKHMWLERKELGLGLGQHPAFSFSFLIPQPAKHMFFPYRGEIVPRVSKSLGHEAGTARRALGRKLGSAGSHSWKLDRAELAGTLQKDGKAPGCWVLMPGSLRFPGWGSRRMLTVFHMDGVCVEGGCFSHSAAVLEEQRTRSSPGAGDLQSGAESELTQVCAQPGWVIAKLLFPVPPQTFLYVSGLGGKGVTHLQCQIALYQPQTLIFPGSKKPNHRPHNH